MTYAKLVLAVTTLFNRITGMIRDAGIKLSGRKEQELESIKAEDEIIEKGIAAADDTDDSELRDAVDQYNRNK